MGGKAEEALVAILLYSFSIQWEQKSKHFPLDLQAALSFNSCLYSIGYAYPSYSCRQSCWYYSWDKLMQCCYLCYFPEASCSLRMARCSLLNNCALLSVCFLFRFGGFVFVFFLHILLLFYEMKKGIFFVFFHCVKQEKKTVIWFGALLLKVSVNLSQLFVSYFSHRDSPYFFSFLRDFVSYSYHSFATQNLAPYLLPRE